jgi:hypothetical protein
MVEKKMQTVCRIRIAPPPNRLPDNFDASCGRIQSRPLMQLQKSLRAFAQSRRLRPPRRGRKGKTRIAQKNYARGVKQLEESVGADKLNWAAGVYRNTNNGNAQLWTESEKFEFNFDVKFRQNL